MPQIGNKGTELDLLIRQGATFGPNECTLLGEDGLGINLTGATLRAQIRKTPSSATASASAVFTITSPSTGTFVWEFTSAETTTLLADDSSEEAEASTYVWDMELQDASGDVIPLLYGKVNVFREVTK